ncbi:M48 family metalloprotease [Mesorhizobium abyssinicae]|uniref:M48 family metalloprotease n=1 Tax=Mesorhizobium abyssinicae TaxID=1209958 RepID=UPI00339642DC
MTLASRIFGRETHLQPLIKSLVLVTALRAGWLAINAYPPDALFWARALLPWPQHAFSWVVLSVDLVLLFYQFRAAIRLTRLLLLRFAPDFAAFLGFSASLPDTEQHLTPRNRSWWPTALLLCAILMLSCCAVTWLVLMLSYGQWAPFDLFMRTYFADRALLVGLVLSVLGLLFGGRYIGRAARDVTTSFGVVTVDESHWLTERVHGLADRLNLPRPAVGVTSILNAFAMGSNQKSSMVVIGKPLFDYEKDELDAIIGHELGHILHNDVARMYFAEGFQRVLVNAVNVLTVIGAFAAAANSKRRSDARRNVQLALGSGRIVRKTVFVASELVAKGISRNREFHADAVGAHLTSPDAMARALKRVHGVADKPTAQERHYGYLMFRGSAFGNLFATHPPLKARLKALDARTASSEVAAAAEPQTHGATPEALAGVGPVALSVRLSPIADGIVRNTRNAFIAVRGSVNAKRLGTLGAVCLLLALVAPAIVSFYGLERRFDDARASAGQAVSSSWNLVAETKEAWFGVSEYTTRLRQLDTREQAVKSAEARLAADRSALAQQTSAGNSNLAGTLAERDQARRQVQDLLLKLDAANADRSLLTARLAQQKTPETGADQADLQRQVASVTQQLSSMTADRDEMVRRNDELRQMNLELKGQIADRDMARVDLDKQIQAFQDRIAGLTNGLNVSQEPPALPAVRPAPSAPQGGYGAFAAAANGTLILTDRSFATEQAATDAVLADCSQYSGGSQCVVKQVFHNTCAAVARVIPVTRKSHYALQLEPTIRDAEEMALSECFQRNHRPCEVTRQVCVE